MRNRQSWPIFIPGQSLIGSVATLESLECHVPGEARINPARRGVGEQAQSAQAGVVCWDESRSGKEEACRVADLDAPDRAWLTLAYVDNRAEIMPHAAPPWGEEAFRCNRNTCSLGVNFTWNAGFCSTP